MGIEVNISDSPARPIPIGLEKHWYSGITDFLKTCWVRIRGVNDVESSGSMHLPKRISSILIKDARILDLFHWTRPQDILANLDKAGAQFQSSTLSIGLQYLQEVYSKRFIYSDRLYNPAFEPILNLKNTLNQELQPISYNGKLQKTVPVLYFSFPSC